MTKGRYQMWQKLRRAGALAALVSVMAVSLAACGGDNANSSGSSSTTDTGAAASAATQAPSDSSGSASGAAQDVKVMLNEWSITPKDVSVNSGKVTFDVSNAGKFTHDLVILQNGQRVGATPKFKSSDGDKTLEVDLKPGTYQLICDITGHKDKGMDATLTVK